MTLKTAISKFNAYRAKVKKQNQGFEQGLSNKKPAKEEQKPIQQPKSLPTATIQTPAQELPKTLPQMGTPTTTQKGDKSGTYSHGTESFDLSKDALQEYNSPGSVTHLNADDTAKLARIRSYENAQKGIASEERKATGIPDWVKNQMDYDYWLKYKTQPSEERKKRVDAAAEAEADKPVSPLTGSENPMQQAGFVGASLVGQASNIGTLGTIAGTTAAGAIGGSIVPGVGTAIGAGAGALAGVAIATGKAFLASSSKTRAQDIMTAKSASRYSMSQLNVIKARAADPNADVEDVLKDYYDYKRTIYASEVMLSDTDLLDEINVNEALDELARVKLWMANEEDSTDAIVLERLYQGGDVAAYNAEMPLALQALNNVEVPK